MVSTVGRHRTKVALELFDSVVASVYRYGFGVWGVTVRQVGKLDDLFVEFVRWLFRLPSRTGRNVILASFARRCAKCDALFLAASQLATASTTKNTIWADAVRDLADGQLRSVWYQVVNAELGKRGFREEVLERGAEFLGERRRRGVEFSQYCFHEHLNCPTGNSADQLRRIRTFGIFPFLLNLSPEQTRYIFSFLTSAWRYVDGLSCNNYPAVCTVCDQENSSAHVLFFCSKFRSIRLAFLRDTGSDFSIEILSAPDRRVQLRIARLGNELFFAIQRMCLSQWNQPDSRLNLNHGYLRRRPLYSTKNAPCICKFFNFLLTCSERRVLHMEIIYLFSIDVLSVKGAPDGEIFYLFIIS